jgi:hypothetical protein
MRLQPTAERSTPFATRPRAGQALDNRPSDYCTQYAASLAVIHPLCLFLNSLTVAVWTASTIPTASTSVAS